MILLWNLIQLIQNLIEISAAQFPAPDADGYAEPPLQQGPETETSGGGPPWQRRRRLLLAEGAGRWDGRVLVLEPLGRDERVERRYQTD